MESKRLQYIVSESGSKFIAHCLDYDLVTSADTFHEAIRRLNFVVAAHVRTAEQSGSGALSHTAPVQYWRKFEALQDSAQDQDLPLRYKVVSCAGADAIQ
jgi:hypothetical protein